MKIVIDDVTKTLELVSKDEAKKLDLYGPEAYQLIAKLWMKTSWNQKYPYTFTWMGRPVIQHPEDMLRLQEIVYHLRPDVIIETGVAHGGSLIFYASLMKSMGYGKKVIGVDIEIRKPNRDAIESHELSPIITLIEGDSISPDTLARVSKEIPSGSKVLVILDSDHSYAHVMKELIAYAPLVSLDSYIVSTDGIMREVADVPRGKPGWVKDNPANAAEDFSKTNPQFLIEEPAWKFNESNLSKSLTAWPSAWLRRTY